MKERFKVWLKAIRWHFFTATIVPVVLGAAIAWYQLGKFNWINFFLVLIGGIFIHAGLNLANDYFDHTSGVDEVNQFPTIFSGGSRVIQEKLIAAEKVLIASICCFLIGIGIGLYLNSILPGNILLIIGIVGIFLAFFYTADPLRIGYTGIGEICCGIGFGPVMVLGSYYVQAQQLSWLPFFGSVPVGILIALVLYINEFPDYDADKKVGKKTLVVLLGKKKAIRIYYLLLWLVYLWIILGVITKLLPYFALIVFFTLPLCLKAINIAKSNYDKIYELLPTNAITVVLHLTIGLFLSGSYILEKMIFGN